MRLKISTTIYHEIAVGSEHKELTIEASSYRVVDRNFGADADGNRGVTVTYLDDDVKLSIWDGKTDVTNKIYAEYKEDYESIEESARRSLCPSG